jgi:hypothetical protein
MHPPGRRTAPHTDRDTDRGTVTAETALALPAVVIALTLVLGVAEVAAAQVRCLDAARAAARRAARGDAAAAVTGVARAVGPAGSTVTVGHTARTVTVVVATTVRLPLPGRPALLVRSGASADVESAP